MTSSDMVQQKERNGTKGSRDKGGTPVETRESLPDQKGMRKGREHTDSTFNDAGPSSRRR